MAPQKNTKAKAKRAVNFSKEKRKERHVKDSKSKFKAKISAMKVKNAPPTTPKLPIHKSPYCDEAQRPPTSGCGSQKLYLRRSRDDLRAGTGQWQVLRRKTSSCANVDERLEEHKNGKGSAWTRLHRPLRIAEITRMRILSTRTSLRRSGCSSELDAVLQQLRGSTDQCFVCGSKNHFAAKCPDKKAGVVDDDADGALECLRCGRDSHTAESCYAKSHAHGSNWCLRCGREGHEEASCYARTHAVLACEEEPAGEEGEDEDSPSDDDEEEDEEQAAVEVLKCLRCGRDGHASDSCYAKTHVNGAKWCLRCGREGHDHQSCYAKAHATGAALERGSSRFRATHNGNY
ncbi:Zinc finger, CCHC-type [Phytophthora cactorum]|nr:Zinc finger, CCHC-type [Phytophthora cactorum]